MKKIYTLAFLFMYSYAEAQVDLPHTLTFTHDDATAWADGIAEDGDGGSSNINGLAIEIMTTNSSFTLLPSSTIFWEDNSYYASSDPSYNAITSGPDTYVTNNGAPAMVIRSANPAVDFSLHSILVYDWGGYSPLIISTYNNGSMVGSIEVEMDNITNTPQVLSQSDELLPEFFSEIDEIRFYPKPPSTAFNLSFNNILLADPNAVLPVKLTSFSARQEGNSNTIRLEWETGQEENNSHFEIEKSTNGRDFISIGKVEAKNNPGGHHYSYLYMSDGQPVSYFRLRQVDIDGKFTHSRMELVRLIKPLSLTVTPNPATDRLRIQSADAALQSLTLFDATGKRFAKVNNIGSPTYELDISAFPSGIYFLQVVRNGIAEKHKIIKR